MAVGHALSGGYRGVLPVWFRISCRARLWKAIGFPENVRADGRRASNCVGRRDFVKPWPITIQKPVCRESMPVGQLMARRLADWLTDG